VLHVVGIEVGNTLGNFRAGDATALLDHLESNFTVGGGLTLSVVHEGVVDVVARADNLNIVHVVRVNSGETDTTVVHLSSEDFVSEEIVSEKTRVRVRVEQSFSDGDINEISEERVHRVILLLGIVEMFSVLVNSVASEHVLKEQETVVVGVLYGRSIVVDNVVGVDHFIITDEHKSRSEDVFLTVGAGSLGILTDSSEGLVHVSDEFFVVDISSSDNDHVITKVVDSTVVVETFNGKRLNHIAVTLDRLSHHVVSVRVVMSLFDSLLHKVLETSFVHGGELLLGEFNFG